MNWYVAVLKKYSDFSGRARRKEYWMFYLINTLISIVIAGIDTVFDLGYQSGVTVLYCLYSLAIVVPSIAVTVRRLHDTGRSGWWWLIALVPIIGTIIFLVYMASNSQPGDNRYGPNPKAMAPA
jgi:uncharacterized membrane protein YhaH (DUF805 family)